MLSENIDHINMMLPSLYVSPIRCFEARIHLNDGYYIVTENYKVSSLLKNSDVRMMKENGFFYQYKSLKFTVASQNAYLLNKNEIVIIYELDKYKYTDIVELIQLLIDTQVIGEYNVG